MGKVDFRTLHERERTALREELFETIDSFRSQADMRRFLSQLLTESEIIMFARRVRIAKLLVAGKTVDRICKKLRVGLATVQSVDRWLRLQCADYRSLLPPIYADAARKKFRGRNPMPSDFTKMRRKYPLHFLFLNLLLEEEWK